MIEAGSVLKETYDPRLVILSIAIAVFGSYIAFDLAEQITDAQKGKKYWLAGGTATLGISIWAQHFVAMLAYRLPIPIAYSFPVVLVAMAVAIAGAGAGLYVVTRKHPLTARTLVLGALLIGLGIIGLHLTAMEAVRVDALTFYDPKWMTLSVVMAVGFSGGALGIAFHQRSDVLMEELGRKVSSVVLMATAIVSMHYSAMTAVDYRPIQSVTFQQAPSANHSRLAVIIGAATLVILLLTILASFFGQRSKASKATAIARRQSEERFRALVQNALDIIAIVTADGKISYVSPSVEGILQYKPDDWLGKKACQLIHPDDISYAERFWQEVLNTADADLTEEFRLQHVDRSWRVFEIVAKNLLANVVIEGIVATCRDITERKRSELELQESRKKYRDLYDNAPDAYFSVAPDGSILSVNQFGADYLGYSKEELVGTAAELTIYEPDRTWFQQWLEETFNQKRLTDENEVRKLCKNSSYRWVRERSQLLLDENSHPTELHIICRDITARKRSEAELQKSQKKYRDLYDNAPDAYFSVAPDGSILSVNQFGADYLGYSKEELIGQSALITVYEPDREWVQQWLENTFTKQQLFCEQELRKRHKNGSPLWIRQRSQLLLDEEGAPVELHIIGRDITEQKQAEQQLFQNAFYDPLTRLPNRALFMDRLNQALERSQRQENYLFAVLFLDLDRFKVINDSLGHTTGDLLLIAIARRLEQCLRPVDTAARLGGDEFTVLLEDIRDISDAIRVAERIQEEIGTSFIFDGQEVFTGTSIGIALNAGNYSQAVDLLRDADIAMYRAKERGKGRYEMFNDGMLARAVERLQLETDLRRAVEQQEFELFYQPIISLATGTLTGFEALIRWQHPQRGLLEPEEFITIAQETSLITQIGQWTIEQTCKQLQEWRWFTALAGQPLTASVNICSIQFEELNLIEEIRQVLQETQIESQALKLEITENEIMSSDDAVLTISHLQELGIELYIDDFGTGYSSLSRLHRFPISGLKIDRSFISGTGCNGGNLEIVETIIALAQKLAVNITAEGIETVEQFTQLKQLQCHYGQGYFFSKPLDKQQATALLSANPRW